MEDVGQNLLDDEDEITEIPTLEAIKQNLKYLNSDLEKDLQRLDEANQTLLRKIQKKEESIQSLERDIALSIGRVPERDDFNEIIVQKETALKDLELEIAKLEKKNKTLSKNVMELQKKVRRHPRGQVPYSLQHCLYKRKAGGMGRRHMRFQKELRMLSLIQKP
ncbi:transmembrane and coiled-coil domain-containing protein 5B isoform X4 [Rattus norvegicus]|nr:transmembrane and coiled-coil domain-containing protein 5B isoform X4 [Rattus norvegicus]